MKKTRLVLVLAMLSCVVMLGFLKVKPESANKADGSKVKVNEKKVADTVKAKANKDLRTIYLAGGCFWGVEGYFKKVPGVYDTTAGYANGKTNKTDYHKIASTDHAETVKVDYDISKISLEEILLHYFRIIDPKSVNKQGNDKGRQYRTGIYYVNEKDGEIARKVIRYEEKKIGKTAVELQKLNNFINAEDYHQDFLEKNPGGYCHLDLKLAQTPLFGKKYGIKSKEELKKELDELTYDVIVNAGTEKPFSSPLNNEYRKGIYVDKTTGEPLFSSKDKFESGCGWPSFSKPILSGKLKELSDKSLGMNRIEVRSGNSDAHLGHVFEDGPKEKGGLRYCINGASLRFIPYEDMDKEGYGEYKILCE